MKKILIIVLLTITLCGCDNKAEAKDNVSYKELMKDGNYLIIDVRTKEEYNESHIKDAINIPYDEINEASNIDKEKTIFVYCRSGARSSIAYQTLTSLNYNVYDLGAFESIDLPKE